MKIELNDYNLVVISEEEMVKVLGGKAMNACGDGPLPKKERWSLQQTGDRSFYWVVWK